MMTVTVIPQDIASDVANEAIEMTAYEDFVVERVKGSAAIIGFYLARRSQSSRKSLAAAVCCDG